MTTTLSAALANLATPPTVLYAADAVALAGLDAAGDLDLDAAIFLDPAEARRLAADLIDAATKAETAPPTARTLHLVGGAR